MSITNLLNKIKSKINFDKQVFLLIIVVILVGGSSFGLGRLSVNREVEDNIIIENIENKVVNEQETGYNKEEALNSEKRYVASKNGTKYYSRDCSGANRIKLENQIWFKNREDAEKSGFTYSSTCK
jgi:hypothetical protein